MFECQTITVGHTIYGHVPNCIFGRPHIHNSHTRTHTYTRVHTLTHVRTHTHTRTHTHIRTHTHTHEARTYTHTRSAHTHTHTYTKHTCTYKCNCYIHVVFTIETNREILLRAGFMKQFGKEWLFPSIEDAVRFATEGNKVVS